MQVLPGRCLLRVLAVYDLLYPSGYERDKFAQSDAEWKAVVGSELSNAFAEPVPTGREEDDDAEAEFGACKTGFCSGYHSSSCTADNTER